MADDAGGARAAAQHLVDLGHRRLGIVTVGEDLTGRIRPADQRSVGWREPLDAAGVEPVVAHATPRRRLRRGPRAAGRTAVAALLALIDGKDPPPNTVLRTELVVRESTAPADRLRGSSHEPRAGDAGQGEATRSMTRRAVHGVIRVGQRCCAGRMSGASP
jgi:DNA-binding LacI/PurR family transcriptional regulator